MNREQIAKDLRTFKKVVDCDDVRFKEIIKQKLLNNEKILYAINNKELEDTGAEASDYFGINILPYYFIVPTQSEVENFVCYEVSFSEEARHNKIVKYGQIIFYLLCE